LRSSEIYIAVFCVMTLSAWQVVINISQKPTTSIFRAEVWGQTWWQRVPKRVSNDAVTQHMLTTQQTSVTAQKLVLTYQTTGVIQPRS
jgi:hypothetical protein